MQKAMNRLWDWLFHPSIRAYTNPNSKAKIYRYPSPGNIGQDLVTEQQDDTDYKTPYQHSRYDVRYGAPTPAQTAETVLRWNFDSPGLTPIKKLLKTGVLKKGQENNPDAVAEAKKQFQAKFGVPVEQRVYQNDSEQPIPKSANREQLATYFQHNFQSLRDLKYNGYDYSFDRKTIDDPEIVPLQSVDMYTAPHFQESKIQNEYMIEEQINENVRKGKLSFKVGDARFWKAIDDSFPKQEVEKIENVTSKPNPKGFDMKDTFEVELEIKDGQVKDLHPQK